MSSFRRRTIIVGTSDNCRDGRIPLNLTGEPVIWACQCGEEYDMEGAESVRCHVCGQWKKPRPLKTLQRYNQGGGDTATTTAAPPLLYSPNDSKNKTCGQSLDKPHRAGGSLR